MPVMEGEEIGGDVRKIQGFRKWRRGAFDAGKFEPAWDAGMDPQEKRGGNLVVLLLAERAR
jgi:hypothetical protein